MPTINGKVCVVDGRPVDKVFSNGKQVYGRNLYLNSKALEDNYARNSNAVNITVEPFDSTTNMWHFVAEQGIGDTIGIYFYDYAIDKIPDNSDWSYSADVKGTGKPVKFAIENGSMNPVIGTVGSEWSRVSQTGRVGNPEHSTIVMYFDTTSSPLDVYIKLPKLEIGTTPTPWTPAPEDVLNGYIPAPKNLKATVIDLSTEKLDWE